MAIPKQPPTPRRRVRTFFAGLCGALALSLVTLSILVVWANRTLTDTTTYVRTVTPLISQPAIQSFIVTRIDDQLQTAAPTPELAQQLLPNSPPGTPESQLQSQLSTLIASSVQQIITSKQLADLWRNTNQSVHAQLMSQLQSNSTTLSLDFSPALQGVTQMLATTPLAPVADKLQLPSDAGKILIQSSAITRVHKAYRLFQLGTWAIVLLTLLLAGLAVWLSVHHQKTLRRILVGTGLLSLLLALELQLPSIVKLKGADPAAEDAARAVVQTLFHNLQLACLIIGLACLAVALGSKLLERYKSSSLRPRK